MIIRSGVVVFASTDLPFGWLRLWSTGSGLLGGLCNHRLKSQWINIPDVATEHTTNTCIPHCRLRKKVRCFS